MVTSTEMPKRKRPTASIRTRNAATSAPCLTIWVVSALLLSSLSTETSDGPLSRTNDATSPFFPVVAALPELKRTSSSVARTKEQRIAREKLQKSLSESKPSKASSAEESDQRQDQSRTREKFDHNDDNNGKNTGTYEKDKNNIKVNNDNQDVTIESFLARREFPLRTALRSLCLFLTTWSSLQCLRTSGIPYARTVWQIVYGDGATVNDVATAVKNYIPTAMDCKLAQMILSSNDDFNIMLPPMAMPSAGPLLGLVASMALYIGLTILLPRWSTQFRVLLDYSRVDRPSVSDTPRTTNSSGNGDDPATNTSVLVRVGTNALAGARKTSRKNLLVFPLQQSSVVSKMNRKKPKKNKPKKSASTTGRDTEAPSLSIDSENYLHPSDFYFEMDNGRIYCDPDTKACTEGGPKLQEALLSDLKQLVDNGGIPKTHRATAMERYQSYNRFRLPTPTFREAFLERISSPLVVIQLVGKLVSLLEEGMGALVSTCITLGQHYFNAQQAIVSAKQLAQEVQTNLQDDSECKVSIWKEEKQKWKVAKAGDLLPGDIFRLQIQHTNGSSGSKKSKELIVPVDALVLKGQCLTNEAILTGESVPQIKIPLDFEGELLEQTESTNDPDIPASPPRRLDVHKDRSSVLFAGTTLFHTLGSNARGPDPKNSRKSTVLSSVGDGVTCLALRTGTYSSKGNLLKALKGGSAQHVGAISNEQSELDAIRIVASLSMCALVSCLSLFVNNRAAAVSPFRRVIQCTRIALASIPSDLPLALATVARSCSNVLRHQSDVVCSEPGSLLTAAYVDTVVFDKTGTLTADTQSLSKVVSTSSQSDEYATQTFQRFVLAGCHSLIQLEEDGKIAVVGDPLDQAALKFSQWRYNQTLDCYFRPETDTRTKLPPVSEPVRLWQICSFPFDPSRRLSSAIVLLQRKDSSLELWKLTKGSPDTIIKFIDKNPNRFDAEYNNQTQELEMEGYRSIALGAENLANSSISDFLFPKGLSADVETLVHARGNGESLHRNAVDTSGLAFCGFCCFEASIRPSSKRVINELLRGKLNCIMLTGDSVDAALSVARKVDIYTHRKTAVLERSENSSGEEKLVWRILTSKIQKDGSFKILHHRTKMENFTVSSTRKYIKGKKEGKYSLGANGRALELILFGRPDKAGRLLAKNLGAVSVIARATPELKKQVIETLKHECGKRVMMCGDGVNDVAAIQSADVAASLLTGFGAESVDLSIDVDDVRRKKRLDTLKIGSNRAKNVGRAKKEEANERIRKEIEKYREQNGKRSSSPNDQDPESLGGQNTFEDVKEMISATMVAARNERQRAEQLRKGGGDAARILAEERRAHALTQNGIDDADDTSVSPQIKPGEASLVSSFSCLHPSVDGIDAILRQGIATAASALASQQGIGLHSLMSCFHLATLYRDGFRYGKHMFNVEILFYMILENARNKASCSPRPRLPNSVIDRPPASIFQVESIFETISQVIVHISCMALSVAYAKTLENDLSASIGNERIRLGHLHGSTSKKVGKLMDTLSKRSTIDPTEREKEPSPFFQRAPFRSNYETNVVFIFSILQSAISALVSHKGDPFYHSILESQDLCKTAGATLVFATVCITGKMSPFTTFLEVKPLPSRQSKLVFLGIIAINITACVICRYISDSLISSIQSTKVRKTPSAQTFELLDAADHEEKLLREERVSNTKGLRVLSVIILYLLMDVLLSS